MQTNSIYGFLGYITCTQDAPLEQINSDEKKEQNELNRNREVEVSTPKNKVYSSRNIRAVFDTSKKIMNLKVDDDSIASTYENELIENSTVRKMIDEFVEPGYKKLEFSSRVSFWLELFKLDNLVFRFLINDEKMSSHFAPHQSEVYKEVMKGYFKTELPDITTIHADAPINLIWLGSLLPEKIFRQHSKNSNTVQRQKNYSLER